MSSYEHNSISYIQIPPDSTGKALQALKIQNLPYSAKTGGFDFAIGQTITGGTSLAVGEIIHIDVDTSTTGTVRIVIPDSSPVDTFNASEAILFESVQKAVAGTPSNTHIQSQVISGGNNPAYHQYVDQKGAAYVRFSEGEQQINAFGLSRYAKSTEIARYYFKYGTDNLKFKDIIIGDGGISHLPNEASVAFDVTEADNDSVIRSTNRYHLYQPGFSQLMQMTVQCGDTGKADVTRRWGAFDGYNGMFFELENTTLSVVLRSSTSGGVIESRINQDDWNGDKLDGTGGSRNLSQHNLDVSKINIFWIDYAWLGAGIVRMGVYDSDGNRVTAHSFRNSNLNSTPYMAECNLPLRWEIFNTGVTASPSRLKLTCASVITEGEIPSDAQRGNSRYAFLCSSSETIYDGYFTPVLSARPVQYVNGIVNRKIIVPESINIYSSSHPVIMMVYGGAIPNNPNFQQYSISSLEFDEQSTSLTGGLPMFSIMANAGTTYVLDQSNSFSAESSSIFLNADGTHGPYLSIAFKCLVPGQTTNVCVSFNWVEI